MTKIRCMVNGEDKTYELPDEVVRACNPVDLCLEDAALAYIEWSNLYEGPVDEEMIDRCIQEHLPELRKMQDFFNEKIAEWTIDYEPFRSILRDAVKEAKESAN